MPSSENIRDLVEGKYYNRIYDALSEYITQNIGELNDMDRWMYCGVGLKDCAIKSITDKALGERIFLEILTEAIISIYDPYTDEVIIEWYRVIASVDSDFNDFQPVSIDLYTGPLNM